MRRDGNMQLIELLLRHLAGRAHHDILGVLVHREGNDLADGIFTGEQHDHAVDARGDTGVRGRAVAEGVVHGGELLLYIILAEADELEGLDHELLLLVLLTARDENGFCYLDAEGLRGSTLFWWAKLVGLAYLAAAFLRCSWTLSHWKQETPKEELKTLLLLALVSAAGFLLQGWLPGRGLLCCGITLGLVCVYVLVLQTKFTVDTLTGVSNRIVALRYLESELPYYRRHPNRSLHFLMMDMDHFKHINDEYGHLEGDAALVLLAGILKKVCANYNGVLARYGGDEFCIACGCNSVEVRTLIASIQRELDAANAASGKPYQIEISIGCARLEPDIATVHDLVDKADREMYHLKTRKHGTAPAEKQG